MLLLAATALFLSADHAPAADSSTVLDMDDELTCLAATIYFEGRGEPPEGQQAVAHVVLNRLADAAYPSTVCEVVKHKREAGICQFEWWCDDVPNLPTDAASWRRAKSIARLALIGRHRDPTGGALYFHTLAIKPNWAADKVAARVIGQHVFFRLPRPSEDGEHAADQGVADDVALVQADDSHVR